MRAAVIRKLFANPSFFVYVFIAFIILQIPLISIPFKWLESYFQEMSHGISALITGGNILRIELFTNGAGLCTTQGGSRFIVSFMGYAGATAWGVLLYVSARSHQRVAQASVLGILLLLICTVIFWVSDLLTLFILLVLIAVCVLKLKLPRLNYIQHTLKLLGLMVLLNSIQSPLYLFDGRSMGDGATLSQLTYIPEFLWVCIWFGIGCLSLYYVYTLDKKRTY